METKVREACTARITTGYTAPSEAARPYISVGTLKGPYAGTQSRKKVSASGTIVAEIPHGASGQGRSWEDSSGATEALCMTHNVAGVFESIKKKIAPVRRA